MRFKNSLVCVIIILLTGVSCLADTYEGWVIGCGGIILHTTSGGETWNPQESGTSDELYGVSFVDVNHGWVVGNNGIILHTTDGGDNWDTQTSGVSNYLWRVHFENTNEGWAVGFSGTILHTTDGGETWNPQESGTSWGLYGIDFVNPDYGWVVGWAGTIVHTTDGGQIWDLQESGTFNYIFGVDFVDTSEGWAVGKAGMILHTIDGGENWISQSSNTDNYLWSVSFIDTHTGWAVGNLGTIVRTTNGGGTWVLQSSGTDSLLYRVYFVNSSNGWAVGRGGTILHTDNGGESWSPQSSNTSERLYDVWLSIIVDHTPPMVTVLYPNGGEVLGVSDTCDITWYATDNIGVDSISIFYSINAGNNWDTIVTGEPNDSLYEWIIPDTPSDSCLVKILAYDPSLNIGEDQSDSLFIISPEGINEDISSPKSFVFFQATPNPFKEKTEITFSIGQSALGGVDSRQKSVVSLKIYDVSGRLVKDFSRLTLDAVRPTLLSWDGRDDAGNEVQSGVYFCRLAVSPVVTAGSGGNAGDYQLTKKLLLVR